MIRPARAADIPRLNRIEQAATASFAAPIRARAASFPPLPADAFAPAVDGGRAWVASDAADEIVGFVACGFLDAYPFVIELSVLPGQQRRGYGSALLTHAAAWARPWRCLLLTTFRDVAFNAPVYARRGFVALEPCARDRPELAAQLAAERNHWDGVAARVAMIRLFG